MICDKCQKIFDEKKVKRGTLNLFSEEMDITLCNECANKLDEWIHPEETEIINEWTKGKNDANRDKGEKDGNV